MLTSLSDLEWSLEPTKLKPNNLPKFALAAYIFSATKGVFNFSLQTF